MAFADLRKELECSVCLNIYTDPVNLKCGHNFCQDCIDRVLDTQGESGGYSCPECRVKFQERPALQRNITLRNIVENFLTAQPDREHSGVFCTQCILNPVPAVKCCVLCEASLCDDHLRVHSKAPEHALCDPTTSMENRKCSVHRKVLEYYCTEDSTCICVSCRLDGQHRGHQVDTLKEASEKKKKKLRNALQKLMTEREKTEKKVQSLEERRRNVQRQAAGDTERVTALFRDLRRHLERKILREISERTERTSIYVSEIIRDLEIKKDELFRKARHIDELCSMTDPLPVLQESDTGDSCDIKDGHVEGTLDDGRGPDVYGMSHQLRTLCDVIKGVNVYFCIQEAEDISLDMRTVHNNLHISRGRRTVCWSPKRKNRPQTPQRFQDFCPQMLSCQSFSSGRHYWEVEVGGSKSWRVGMCYPSIERGGVESGIGCNKKSWGLRRWYDESSVLHNSHVLPLPTNVSSNRIRIELDYDFGRISFYDLCDPIRHLHTFTTTFTEPLHAGLGIWEGCIKICGEDI